MTGHDFECLLVEYAGIDPDEALVAASYDCLVVLERLQVGDAGQLGGAQLVHLALLPVLLLLLLLTLLLTTLRPYELLVVDLPHDVLAPLLPRDVLDPPLSEDQTLEPTVRRLEVLSGPVVGTVVHVDIAILAHTIQVSVVGIPLQVVDHGRVSLQTAHQLRRVTVVDVHEVLTALVLVIGRGEVLPTIGESQETAILEYYLLVYSELVM